MAGDEQAVMWVLMLRGPQTPGELKQRAERMHAFAELAAVHETLERLIERGLVACLERRPGQKEERYAQLLEQDAGRPGRCSGSAIRVVLDRRSTASSERVASAGARGG